MPLLNRLKQLKRLKINKARWWTRWWKFLKFFNRVKQRVLFVGQNSGFHGMNRLFSPKANLFSSVFWLIIIIASIGGLYLMMEPAAELGVDINYTPDTLYLDWTTTFPAFTVCEECDPKTVLRIKVNVSFPDLVKPLSYSHARFLTDLLYSRGTCNNKEECAPCGTHISCEVPWRHIIDRVHLTCEAMLADCSYNGVEFPCCHFFQQVDSEHGPCYAFNTLQHKEHLGLFVVNMTTGPGVLRFRALANAYISIHSTEELSTNNLDTKLKKVIRPAAENEADWLFSVVEMENDILLADKAIHERGCRYLHEIPNETFYIYPVYSEGACQLARITEEMFAQCGCIHPVRDLTFQEYFCNYTGMNCWNSYQEFRTKKTKRGEGCLPSCVESEVTTLHFTRRRSEKKINGVMVNIQMAFLPTLRYQRNLIRTNLDLVVSVGGIAGLFFSASILSFLEIFYLIFRPQKFETL